MLFALAGVILCVLVASALSVVGTDEVTESKPLQVKDGTYAVVLDEAIVPYSGTSATIEAHNSEGKNLFIGTANGVDTDNFLDGVSLTQIENIEFPGALDARPIPGREAPDAAITDRDWWTNSDTGQSVSKSFDLDADPEVIVIAPAEAGENLDGTTVTLNMRVEGVLGWSLLGIALVVLMFGLAVFFALRWWNGRIRPEKKNAGPRNTETGDLGRGSSDPSADSAATTEVTDPATTEGGATEDGTSRPTRPAASPTDPQGSPRRRDRRKRGTLRVAVVFGTGLALSGCSVLPVAQPDTPEASPYERTAVRAGEAGAYMTSYTETLDSILKNDGDGLEKVQGGPLIDRTRAQMQIATRAKEKLSAPSFAEVVAGGPSFEQYPMWFYAFGTTDADKPLTQVQLVTRDSASANPIVQAAAYIPADRTPTLLADGNGAVDIASDGFVKQMPTAAKDLAKSLTNGKIPDDGVSGLDEGGFSSFRDYVKGLRDKDSGFDKVDVKCAPYADLDFSSMALSTKDGAIGLGEVRCTLTITVPQDYAVDLGDTVEAVKTNDKDGDVVEIDTAHPYVLLESADTISAVSTDWDIISSRVK